VESMKKLITKGACFLIGDGNSIDVWKEPWVPWIHGFIPKPRTPSLAFLPISVVELIDPTTNSWIDAKLSELFDYESITAIKRIVLPSAPRPNKLIWILNPKGNFTVKSAIRANQVNVDEASNEYWKKIWKLKIHDRYKLLVWRIATGILPTKLNIAHKMGITDTCCPLCHMNEESIEHLFFQCSISRAIWFGTSWAIHSSRLSLASCQDILKLICEPPIFTAAESSKAKDILLQTSIQFAITLDCIWNLRNQVVFKDLQVNLLVQIKNLETRIMEHINALEDPGEFGLNKPYSAKYWTAPPPASMKLNVDASIRHDLAAIAVVARDHKGIITNAWAKEIELSDPVVAEAAAINWALQLAANEKFANICVESDAKVCIDALAGSIDDCWWNIRAITARSLDLAVNFDSCNMLAKVTFSLDSPFSCTSHSLPPSVVEAWNRDLLSFSS
jgi:ribonuclease HI